MKTRIMIGAPVGLLGLLLALFLMIQPAEAVGTAPMVRTENVQNVLLATQTITATPVAATLNSAAVRVDGYTSADVFVTATFSGTGALTATIQFAADTSNYVDAYFRWADADELNTETYQLLFDGNGTQYLSLPTRGQNMRIRFQPGGLTGSENVAPTVRAVMKN